MLIASFLLASWMAASSNAEPKSHLEISPCDVGEHWQFETASCDFELANTGDRPIHISDGEGVMPWDNMDKAVVVPAHGKAYLKATIATRDHMGYIRRSFRFKTDEPGTLGQRGSTVYAFVVSALDQNSQVLDFGAFKAKGDKPSKSITLDSREVPDFRITGILSKPDYIEVSVGDDRKTVRVSFRGDIPWGILHEKVKLQTNVPQQKEAWLTIDANVIGEVAPNGNPISMGLMRTNNKNEFMIRLTSESGKDFKIGGVKLNGVKGSAISTACDPAASGCRLVKVSVSNDQGLGRLQGTVDVELPEFGRTLPIQVVGMLLNPTTKVHDLDEEREAAGAAKSSLPEDTQEASKNLNIGRTLREAVDAAHEEPPAGQGPLLTWSVANEGSVYGYLIYRADEENGKLVRINRNVILVKNREGGSSNRYQWRDISATSGKTYWYAIDMLKSDGKKELLVDRQKVVAK